MIEVLNLKKTFNTSEKESNTVDDVSFKVNRSEIYGIIGLSGAGKPILVRLLNGLEEPTSGKVIIDDADIASLEQKGLLEARKEISMIFQHFNLFNRKNVCKDIAYLLKLQNIPKNEMEKRANELLDFIGLRSRTKGYLSQLSGGQKQRVAITGALSTSPKVILSGESTNALGPQNTQQVLEILRKLVDECKATIIMITHRMEVAEGVCDRIVVMENGKTIEENSAEELFKNPKTDVTENLVRRLIEENEEKIMTDGFEGDVVRLTYSKESYNKPLLSQTARISGIDSSIISGNISKLQSTGVGYTVIELIGEKENIQKAKDSSTENDIRVEEVK